MTASGQRVKVQRRLSDYGRESVLGKNSQENGNSQRKNKSPDGAAKVSLFVSKCGLGTG